MPGPRPSNRQVRCCGAQGLQNMMLASTAAGNPVVDEYVNGSRPVPQLTGVAGTWGQRYARPPQPVIRTVVPSPRRSCQWKGESATRWRRTSVPIRGRSDFAAYSHQGTAKRRWAQGGRGVRVVDLPPTACRSTSGRSTRWTRKPSAPSCTPPRRWGLRSVRPKPAG